MVRLIVVTAALAALTLAGCGDGESVDTTAPPDQHIASTHQRPGDWEILPGTRKRAAEARRRQERRGRPLLCRNPRVVHPEGSGTFGEPNYRYPGRISPAVGPPYVAPSEFWRGGNNMWRTSDCHAVTVVTAGADGDHRGDGLLAVSRTQYDNPSHPQVSGTEIKVPDAGILQITDAPLGTSVETSAQKHGDIRFTSETGVTGVLDLSDDSVTLSPKKHALRGDSNCDAIPAGLVGKLVAKNWLLRLSVVQAAERTQHELPVRNANELQRYCASHPEARLSRATALILHSDPAR